MSALELSIYLNDTRVRRSSDRAQRDCYFIDLEEVSTSMAFQTDISNISKNVASDNDEEEPDEKPPSTKQMVEALQIFFFGSFALSTHSVNRLKWLSPKLQQLQEQKQNIRMVWELFAKQFSKTYNFGTNHYLKKLNSDTKGISDSASNLNNQLSIKTYFQANLNIFNNKKSEFKQLRVVYSNTLDVVSIRSEILRSKSHFH
ncbi:hypothetical protein AGLY_014411 [Aphis glycines]|uniref:Uncharacterized protein n=1 Tax=Aphis glycines TaxID=307491 RepID=A0A6G0T5J4_APHGL|nr:hypothetical protein AGLY_014411 [Aphis glycines]